MLKFLLLFCISFHAFADEWTSADTKHELVYLVLHSTDWMQTRYISKNPSYLYEQNNILGKHPSIAKVNNYFAATALMHFGVAYLLPREYRRSFQYITMGVEIGAITHNYQIGIKLNFP